MNAEQTIDTAKSLLRIQKYLERLELAKGYHKEYIHTFINKNNTKVPLLTADLKALLQQVAITPAHEDAREHARIEELEAQLSTIGAGGVEPLRKQAAPQEVHPESIREGAPYDNPAFEQLARDMGVWGTAQSAVCAQFWLAATQPAAQGLDAETQRHAAIGKAIERACADLPEETEIIVSLEKDAGTVTMLDQDGNEHENFSCDYGFAGVLNEAIDAALAAQTKHGKAQQ